MRIAINTRLLLDDQLEGIGRYTHHLSKRLVALRPDDEFLFCFDRPFSDTFIYGKNVEGRVVFPPARHPFLWYAWFEWGLPKVLEDWKADVFISMDGYLSLKSKVPSLLVIHDLAYLHFPKQVPFLVNRFYNRYVPKYVKRANTLVTISQYSKADLHNQFGLTDKKIEIIGNGAPQKWNPISDSDKIAVREKWTAGKPYFCALGAIHPRKNISGIIKAFSAFKEKYQSDHQLLIIGRMAWHTDAVKSALNNASCQEDIRMLGYQPDAAVQQILGAAAGLLFLSLFEGFGVPMIEAMQVGVPIVYSNLSVMPEVAGGAGEAVDPLNPIEAAEAMHRILDPKNQPLYAAAAAAQLAKYDWDQSAEKLSELITELGKNG